MKIQNVKGGYDFLPKEQRIRNYINNILRETFEKYGYQSVETPILCYYDILAGKYDEENDILKEIYKVYDQGNRALGLRYDLTVPFAKLIALNKNKIKFPFKRYEINKVFRDGPVKLGRDREFTQCDIDVVGLDNQMIEAELLKLYTDAFSKLNIEIIIQYNSRNLMKGIIIESQVEEDLLSKTITIIDKMDKLSKDEFKQNLLRIGLQESQTTEIMNNFNLSLKELNIKFQNSTNENILKGLEELNELEKYIKALNIEKQCVFAPTLARGQDYYTGNVFEVYEKNRKLNGSIGGGGRYDKMITEFINDKEQYPAVGISFGLTSIYELVKENNILDDISNTQIYIIPMDTKEESLNLATKIRNLGIHTEVEMQDKKIKKSLDYANKEKIPYVIILGSSELETNQIKLKNMFTSTEEIIDLNNLEKILTIIH